MKVRFYLNFASLLEVVGFDLEELCTVNQCTHAMIVISTGVIQCADSHSLHHLSLNYCVFFEHIFNTQP